jgi:hypothetical protein
MSQRPRVGLIDMDGIWRAAEAAHHGRPAVVDMVGPLDDDVVGAGDAGLRSEYRPGVA